MKNENKPMKNSANWKKPVKTTFCSDSVACKSMLLLHTHIILQKWNSSMMKLIRRRFSNRACLTHTLSRGTSYLVTPDMLIITRRVWGAILRPFCRWWHLECCDIIITWSCSYLLQVIRVILITGSDPALHLYWYWYRPIFGTCKLGVGLNQNTRQFVHKIYPLDGN